MIEELGRSLFFKFSPPLQGGLVRVDASVAFLCTNKFSVSVKMIEKRDESFFSPPLAHPAQASPMSHFRSMRTPIEAGVAQLVERVALI